MSLQHRRLDARDIKDQLIGRWGVVYSALLPTASFSGKGSWKTTFCPLHEDRNPSFGVNFDHGGWRCHAGCGSGDAFSLVMKLRRCSFTAAVEEVAWISGLK